MKWITDGSEPKLNGEYAVQMRHDNSLPDDPIERDWVEFIPGTRKWQVAPGWRIKSWLDESPTTANASVLKEALEKVVMRVQNYFDELKENPRNKANGLSKMKNYLAFAIDDARKILAQYSTQSPSSIEESGLKEGEVTCVFCEMPCEPAPTKRGWSAVRHGKGLHFDCAGKVADQGNAIAIQELEDLGKDPLS